MYAHKPHHIILLLHNTPTKYDMSQMYNYVVQSVWHNLLLLFKMSVRKFEQAPFILNPVWFNIKFADNFTNTIKQYTNCTAAVLTK